MKKRLLLACLFLLSGSTMMAVVMTISDSGVYKLRGNISGSTTDSIINIAASDVELDLGGYVVAQSSTGDGIEINGGLSNIIIHHGVIRGTTGTANGVLVNATASSCSKIELDDLRIEDWATSAIYFDGTSASIAVTDSVIKNCLITGCTGANVVLLDNCLRLNMSDCLVSNNTSSSMSFAAVNVLSSQDSIFDHVVVSANAATGGYFNPFVLTASTDCVFRCCSSINNTSSNDMRGFVLFTNSHRNLFDQCMLLGCVSSASSYLYVIVNGDKNVFKQCVALGNSSSSAHVSFRSGPNTSKNILIDCVASAESGGNVSSQGFNTQGTTSDIHFIRCIAANFTNSALDTKGFFAEATSSGCWVQDCIAVRNEGINAANSFGFVNAAGTGNRFIGNFAYRNGTGASTQLSGVNDTSSNQATAYAWENLGKTAP